MASYLIKGGLRAYAFISNMLPAPNDSFAYLLSTLSCDTTFFVASYHRFAMDEADPLSFLQQRFMVNRIGHSKAGVAFEHESFVAWVRDMVEGTDYNFIIERTPSNRSPNEEFVIFAGCSESRKILATIQRIITNTRSSLQVVVDPESAPLSESAKPLTPLSWKDTLSTSLAQAMAAISHGSQSTSSQILAQDKISKVSPLDPADCVQTFAPKGLSFFDLVLLADVVHDQAPIYCLFKNQCYWYARVVFDAVVQRYSTREGEAVSAPSPNNNPPEDANVLFLPVDQPNEAEHKAGRFLGFLINDPSVIHAVVSIVLEKFDVRLDFALRRVSAIDFSDHLLNRQQASK